MKHFIKLPQVIIGETYSEAENHNAGSNKHNTTTTQTFNDPSGVLPRLKWNSYSTINRSTDWEEYEIKEPKRLQLTQPEGPGNFVGCSNLIGQKSCDVSIWITWQVFPLHFTNATRMQWAIHLYTWVWHLFRVSSPFQKSCVGKIHIKAYQNWKYQCWSGINRQTTHQIIVISEQNRCMSNLVQFAWTSEFSHLSVLGWSIKLIRWFWREHSQGHKVTFDAKFWRPFPQ